LGVDGGLRKRLVWRGRREEVETVWLKRMRVDDGESNPSDKLKWSRLNEC
jgi:hypothetical protein